MQRGFSYLARAFLRGFFHLLYHSFAWSYDLVAAAVSLGRWQSWLLTCLPYLKRGKVLELGHGPGHLQPALNAAGFSAFGVDQSRQMAHLARRRLSAARYDARLARTVTQALPFPGAAFDAVASTFPTPYILDPRTLDEAWRVLVPGGRLVVVLNAWISGGSPAERLAAGLFRATGQTGEVSEDLLEPFQAAGFQAQLAWADLEDSRVLLILADKPG